MAEFENVESKRNQKISICPLCSGPNQCALAANLSAAECWCDEVEFPEELLALVPNAARRKICICQQCLRNYLNIISEPQ